MNPQTPPNSPSERRPRAVVPATGGQPKAMVSRAGKRNSGGGGGWLLALFAIGVGAGAYYYVHRGGGEVPEAETPTTVASPAREEVAPAPAVVPEAQPVAAQPPAADEAVAAQVQAAVQARIEAVRAFDGARGPMARGDFAGAATVLNDWMTAHAGHPQRGTIERQVARLGAAAEALPRVLAKPAVLIGAQIPMGNALWPVAGVANGRLTCRVQAQFGTVERPVEITSLNEAARLLLLRRVDAAQQTAFAPTYLLGLGRVDEARAEIRDPAPDAAELRASAEEVADLMRDSEVLAALDHVESSIARRQFANAQVQLDECTKAYANHAFLRAYASAIGGWRSQIASAASREPQPAPSTPMTGAPGDSYPGLPAFSLSTAVAAGDPDRVRLLQAAQWAASTGDWTRHFTELKSALAKAAGSGPWQQRPLNLDRMTGEGAPALAVEQAKFIRAVGVQTLVAFGASDQSKEFLNWLFVRPAVLAAFNGTIEPQDHAGDALVAWRTIWNDDPENRDTLSSLAIACALVYDEPIKISANVYGFRERSASESVSEGAAGGPLEVSSLARYRFYRDAAKKGALKVALPEMTPWELVWVVDAPVPESELVWAQKHVNYSRREWSQAYAHIRYRMDRATQGVNPYSAYTLAEIEKEGGICGDQAYFAAMTAKANGIPAMVIGGEGDRGGHAWFGYEPGRSTWNLNTGRYADNFAAGTTRDPQTGRNMKEQELRQLTDPARRTGAYEKSTKLLSIGALLKDAGQSDLAMLAADAALKAAPKNFAAWSAKLDGLTAARTPLEEWLRESARMRAAFHEFPDLIQEIDKREAAYVAANADSDAARELVRRQTARLERKDKDRSDLILDGVFQEVDLAEKSGDAEAVGRIYRNALRDKGAEVVPFKKIAARYYDWAKTQKKGPEVTRDVISFFDRKHPEPTGDTFAMKAYRGALGDLIVMAKEQGLDELERRLARREDKVKDAEEKLGKLQSKGADR